MTKPKIPETRIMPIAESGNQGGIRMWPSEEWASRLSDWANIGLIVGLIFGVLSTVLLVWMGNVKEAYLKRELADTNLRAANAEQRAADATLELSRIKTPRSLTNIPELVASLEPFNGTEYTFSFVFQDEDSTKLLQALDDVLQRAKWKRVKPPHGFPALEFWGKGGDAVTIGIGTGVSVSVESQESLAVLQARQVKDLPQYVRAAVVLNLTLSSCLSPPQAPSDNKLVEVQKGDSSVVLIGVGKKP
jgi:hypothetical protein